MNKLVQTIGLGHSIAFVVVALLTTVTVGAKAEMPKRISYAIDLELGIAHQCNGTDYAYEVLECKYDYSDLLNR
jgi:hypothetical protein|nr:MAG TPA: hypothetical protein [Caudoviricetes sp.]